MSQQLFRSSAVEHRKLRLHGDVLLLPNIPYMVVTGLLCVWVCAVIFWLVTNHYARKVTALGWLEPPTGIVRVYPEISGTIEKIFITEGSSVLQNQPLMLVKTESQLASGGQVSSELILEYSAQQKIIEGELTRNKKIFENKIKDTEKRLATSRSAAQLLSEQLDTIDQRYNLISLQVEKFIQLKRDGHISNLEYDEVVQQQLILKSEQKNLQRMQMEQKSQIEQLEAEVSLLPDEAENTAAQLQSRLSDITQQITQIKGQSARVFRAARSGIVNNLQAREGQQVNFGTDIPLLTLIPDDAKLVVTLLVPVQAAGFLAADQDMTIRYDAFPYQKFGLYSARTGEISRTILLPNELLSTPIPIQEAVYRITAYLDKPTVQAYGKEFPLKPGMTLSADIRLGERTILEWLLEPIFSLNGRI